MAKEVKSKVIYRKLADLKKLPNNPRTITKKDFERLKQSIEDGPDYFEARPLILSNRTSELVVIAGNQRLEAAKALGMDEVPTVLLEDLDEDREREIVIRDNVANGDWDMDILANEFDFSELQDWGAPVPEFQAHDYYGDERERTDKAMNLQEFNSERVAGKYDIPVIDGADVVPADIIGFNEAKTTGRNDVGVHFFIDDYQFERVWNSPKKYMGLLSKFDCVFTPDFSLYLDMPLAMKIWNVYRARLVGQMMEEAGINVIPTLTWAGDDTLEFVFDGLSKGGTYAVSTVGAVKDKRATELWKRGMQEAIKVLAPKALLLYGGNIDFDFGGTKVYKYSARKFNVI